MVSKQWHSRPNDEVDGILAVHVVKSQNISTLMVSRNCIHNDIIIAI